MLAPLSYIRSFFSLLILAHDSYWCKVILIDRLTSVMQTMLLAQLFGGKITLIRVFYGGLLK